ncbi:hypothetical protein HYD79_00860 [Mycoplasmopsis bovis]|nr:hypothetical protein [Mycoplasmopsis bovis]QQH43023.1 hypothetical protein HYD79_00860 [Mycoplasmopsis bovis]
MNLQNDKNCQKKNKEREFIRLKSEKKETRLELLWIFVLCATREHNDKKRNKNVNLKYLEL